jgi:DNA-binding MurR/RpiR family transcriptional regulator
MITVDKIETAIQAHYHGLSKRQKEIAEKLMLQPPQYLLLPIGECAERLKVSSASLTRFARAVGYQGFNELRRDCRAGVMASLGIRERMEQCLQDSGPEESLIRRNLSRELDCFSREVEQLDYGALARLAQRIAVARQIYLGGLGVSQSLVQFLKFRLRRMGIQVRALGEGGYEFLENLTALQPTDLFLTISFRRVYRELLTGIHYARRIGCPTFALTEQPLSALAIAADECIVIRRGPEDSLNSVAFPMAVCNAVAIAVARQKEQEVKRNLDRLEWLNGQFIEQEGEKQ